MAEGKRWKNVLYLISVILITIGIIFEGIYGYKLFIATINAIHNPSSINAGLFAEIGIMIGVGTGCLWAGILIIKYNKRNEIDKI